MFTNRGAEHVVLRGDGMLVLGDPIASSTRVLMSNVAMFDVCGRHVGACRTDGRVLLCDLCAGETTLMDHAWTEPHSCGFNHDGTVFYVILSDFRIMLLDCRRVGEVKPMTCLLTGMVIPMSGCPPSQVLFHASGEPYAVIASNCIFATETVGNVVSTETLGLRGVPASRGGQTAIRHGGVSFDGGVVVVRGGMEVRHMVSPPAKFAFPAWGTVASGQETTLVTVHLQSITCWSETGPVTVIRLPCLPEDACMAPTKLRIAVAGADGVHIWNLRSNEHVFVGFGAMHVRSPPRAWPKRSARKGMALSDTGDLLIALQGGGVAIYLPSLEAVRLKMLLLHLFFMYTHTAFIMRQWQSRGDNHHAAVTAMMPTLTWHKAGFSLGLNICRSRSCFAAVLRVPNCSASSIESQSWSGQC